MKSSLISRPLLWGILVSFALLAFLGALSGDCFALMEGTQIYLQRSPLGPKVYESPLKAARRSRLRSEWDSYVQRHNEALASPEDHKFFLHRPAWFVGHGNKLPGVVTSFMLALLWNRTLIIDYGSECRERAGCGEGLQWSNFFHQPVEMDFTNLMKSNQALNTTWQGVPWTQDGGINYLEAANKALDEEMEAQQWLWGDGLHDHTAHLYLASPIYGARLRELFTPGETFHEIANYLMRPSSEVERAVTEMAGRFRTLTIGVQIRQEKALMQGGIPQRSYMELAKVLQDREGSPDEDTAIYLATDNLDVRKEWEEHFNHSSIRLLMQPEGAVFQSGGSYGLNRHSRTGHIAAVVELFVLSRTQHIIMTWASSFGATAGGLGKLAPWVVSKDGYYGAAVSDPCSFHAQWMYGPPEGSAELYVHKQCHPPM